MESTQFKIAVTAVDINVYKYSYNSVNLEGIKLKLCDRIWKLSSTHSASANWYLDISVISYEPLNKVDQNSDEVQIECKSTTE